MIVDDIQAGCGRTGNFFSFENQAIEPDIIVLSKSLSGYGLPFSLVLIKPEYDQWEPGQHNGTFRGNNHAFVTAKAALDNFWTSDDLQMSVLSKEKLVRSMLETNLAFTKHKVMGRGLLLGIETGNSKKASAIKKACFERKLIIESCGPHDSVIKIIPPLTISEENLVRGIDILCDQIALDSKNLSNTYVPNVVSEINGEARHVRCL